MTALAPLYAIADELAPIVEQLQESGGVLTPEIEAAFLALSGAFEDKVGNCIAHIRNLEALEKARVDEARRLRESAEVVGKAAFRLREYVQANMERVGEKKIETRLGTARVQKNSRPSIAWPGAVETIPEPFKKVTVSLDGTAAYDAHKAGTLPQGFAVEHGAHLRIV